MTTAPYPPGLRTKFIMVQAVTLARLPLAVLFSVLLLCVERSTGLLLGGLAVLLVIELTDFLDGRLARGTGVRSEWGAMLDPYADSVSRMIVYWALACAGLTLAVVPLGMAVRDITVAYCRVVLTKHGRSVAANWSGKIKAGIQAAGSWVLLLGPLYWGTAGKWTMPAVSIVVLAATLASAVQYMCSAYAAARDAGGAGPDQKAGT